MARGSDAAVGNAPVAAQAVFIKKMPIRFAVVSVPTTSSALFAFGGEAFVKGPVDATLHRLKRDERRCGLAFGLHHLDCPSARKRKSELILAEPSGWRWRSRLFFQSADL